MSKDKLKPIGGFTMKKYLLLLVIIVWQPAFAASSENVKGYLETYSLLIQSLANSAEDPGNRTKVGSRSAMYQNPAFLHMIDVINLIKQGKLDDCCFHPEPNRYTDFANATTHQRC